MLAGNDRADNLAAHSQTSFTCDRAQLRTFCCGRTRAVLRSQLAASAAASSSVSIDSARDQVAHVLVPCSPQSDGVNKLLNPSATPPARWPSNSIFCAWRSPSSNAPRSRSAPAPTPPSMRRPPPRQRPRLRRRPPRPPAGRGLPLCSQRRPRQSAALPAAAGRPPPTHASQSASARPAISRAAGSVVTSATASARCDVIACGSAGRRPARAAEAGATAAAARS